MNNGMRQDRKNHCACLAIKTAGTSLFVSAVFSIEFRYYLIDKNNEKSLWQTLSVNKICRIHPLAAALYSEMQMRLKLGLTVE